MSPSLSVARGHQERTRHEEGLRHRGFGPLDWLQLGESTSLPSQGLPLSKLLFQCQLTLLFPLVQWGRPRGALGATDSSCESSNRAKRVARQWPTSPLTWRRRRGWRPGGLGQYRFPAGEAAVCVFRLWVWQGVSFCQVTPKRW